MMTLTEAPSIPPFTIISRPGNSVSSLEPKMTRRMLLWLLVLASVCQSNCLFITSTLRLPACQAAPMYNYDEPVCGCQPTAEGSKVSCADRNPKLVRIPSLLPEDTVVLNLVDNNIAKIFKGDLDKLESVRTIFFQGNNLITIEGGAFNNLYNLQLLVLSNNRIQYITDTWFQHLPSIKTLDLSNNIIQHIDKWAFFTLPASKSSDVTIHLSGNRIVCDCDTLALRKWSKSLSSTLTQVRFTGFQCFNAAGKELATLGNNEFACRETAPSAFVSQQKCVPCHNQQTQLTCDSERQATCSSPQTVCMSQIKVTSGKVNVYKACSTYTDCLLRSRNNVRLCNTTRPSGSTVNALDCTFCCSGELCNRRDMGGRTRSFTLYVVVQMTRSFESYMLQPRDSRYMRQANIYVQKLNELLQGVDGSYDTTFLSFKNSSGQTYVTCQVRVSVLSTYSLAETGLLMIKVLNQTRSQPQSYFSQQGAYGFHVTTELTTTKRCQQEVTQTPQGPITWTETLEPSTVFVNCPASSSQGGNSAKAKRSCVLDSSGVAKWEDPDVSACLKSDVSDRLKELNSTVIDSNNFNSVLTQLDQLTSDGPNLSAADVTMAVGIVWLALEQGAVLNSLSGMENTLNVVSNVMDAEGPVLVQADRNSRSASRLLAATDKIGAKGKLTGGHLLVTTPNVAVGALQVSSGSFQGATLTVRTATDSSFVAGDVQIQANSSSPSQKVSSFVLPPSLLKSSPRARIAVKALVSDKLFQVIQQSRSGVVSDSQNNVRQINSHVLDATVVNQDVKNLTEPVTMTFVHLNESARNPECTFWDVGKSGWSSEGCSLAANLSTNTSTSCRCDHLTNFALLMDVYGEGASLSETDKRVLSIISYIGCGVSLVSLLLTLLTYILFKKLRRDNPSKILVNLCVALALSNLVFVAGMQPYALDNLVGCKIVAVLLHFSLLSALCWMAVEAFYMYLALVLVFKTYFTNFILKCSLIGWGVPLVTVAITLGVNRTDNYGPLDSGVCWLNDLAFYIAFVAPVGLILVINFMAFGLVLHQILGLAGRKLNKSDSFSVSQQLRGALGVAILLGLTWIFALFAVDRASVVFYYLFAIFNSLQGLWIFVFYCVLKKEARNSWRRALPCWRSLDKSGISNTRDKHDQYSNSRSAGYSGTAMKTERSKSSTDTGVTTTTAFTSSSMDSEGVYVNEQKEKPKAVETSQVQIKLTNNAANQGTGDNMRPTSNQPTNTVHRSAGNIPVPASVPKGVPQFVSVITTTQDTKPVGPSGGKEGGEPSPRPLHFKVGYTLSNTSTNSADMSPPSEAPNTDDSGQASVSILLKR
ncbi:hypothetical protein ACOMHN_044099 [Nucella lapillus]